MELPNRLLSQKQRAPSLPLWAPSRPRLAKEIRKLAPGAEGAEVPEVELPEVAVRDRNALL